MDQLSPDIHEKVLNEVYKRGLPKVKTLKVREMDKSLKKINQICDYKSFDKKSLENQEKKLKDMFVSWLLWKMYQNPSPNWPRIMRRPDNNFIGTNKQGLMTGTLLNLEPYWTNENMQNYFCHLIKSMDFKNGNHLTEAWNLMIDFIIESNEYNLLKKKPFDDIILDTVKNNRSKICRFLDNEFKKYI